MKISIENFNNIKNLDYIIKEHKINFLFGISGCGKSSIACALTNDDYSNHIPYGHPNLIPKVKVDGVQVADNKSKMFDYEYMQDILINKSQKNDIYNIIVGDNGDIDAIRKDYLVMIKDLVDKRELIYNLLGKITTLENDLKIAYKQDGTYKSTCLIKKLTTNLTDKDVNYLKNKNLTSSQIKWISDGTKTDLYKQDKCPFCNKKLSKYRKEQINKILVFDSKTYEKINSKSNIFVELNIKEPNWIKRKEVDLFNKQIADYHNLLPELQNIVRYIVLAEKSDISLDDLKLLKVSKEMKTNCPDIADAIDEFNKKYGIIRRKIGEIKKKTDKLLSRNLKEINDYLNLLGIKYVFCKDYIDDNSKEASFIIKAIVDKKSSDRISNLSFGEKNIIGLILFMISNRKYELLIVDDPASSFDEYRRKVVFDILYKLKSPETTMLVLSHDHVFAKYAVYHFDKSTKEKYKSNMDKLYFSYTGNVDYIQTYNETKIIPITKDSFNTMTEFIKRRITYLGNNMSYQMAINMRLYYELNKARKYHKAVYGYLSSILHRYDKNLIIEKLEKDGKKEKDILDVIKEDFKEDFNPLKYDYLSDIEIDKFNNFEKIIYARECCKKSNKGRVIKDELSNVVHMNQAYAICLNPYEYNYFSNYVYEYLTNELGITIQ